MEEVEEKVIGVVDLDDLRGKEYDLRITEWYPTIKGIEFAMEQLEVYSTHGVYKRKLSERNEVSYAVFRKKR